MSSEGGMSRRNAATLIAFGNGVLLSLSVGLILLWQWSDGPFGDELHVGWSLLGFTVQATGIVTLVLVAGAVSAIKSKFGWKHRAEARWTPPDAIQAAAYAVGIGLTFAGVSVFIQGTGGPYQSPFGQLLVAMFIRAQSFVPPGERGSRPIRQLGASAAGLLILLTGLTQLDVVDAPRSVPLYLYALIALVALSTATYVNRHVKLDEGLPADGIAPATGSTSGVDRMQLKRSLQLVAIVGLIGVVVWGVIVTDALWSGRPGGCIASVEHVRGGGGKTRIAGKIDNAWDEIILVLKVSESGRFTLLRSETNRDQSRHSFISTIRPAVDFPAVGEIILLATRDGDPSVDSAIEELGGPRGADHLPTALEELDRQDRPRDASC